MTITVRKVGDFNVLDLKGPLKIGDAERAFRSQIEQLIQSGVRNFAVNLSEVPMMDSSGIGAITRTFKAITEQGGKMTFFGAPKMVRMTLKMVGLDRYLGMYEDESSALAAS